MNTEQIYSDFTTKMLPKIAEGFSITKDYFFDLFGRYIKYLLVIDSFWMIFGLIIFIGGCYSIYGAIKFLKNGGDDADVGWVILSAIVILIGFGILTYNLENLAKDIYIPEIRIYEELKGFTNSN